MPPRTYQLDGLTLTISQLRDRAINGISNGGLRDRLSAGWDVREAITKPVLSSAQIIAFARRRSSFRMGQFA